MRFVEQPVPTISASPLAADELFCRRVLTVLTLLRSTSRPTDLALVPHHRAQPMRKGGLLKALKSRRNFENYSPCPQMWQTCGFLCVCSIANLTRNRKHQQSHEQVCSVEVSWPFSDTEKVALLSCFLLG